MSGQAGPEPDSFLDYSHDPARNVAAIYCVDNNRPAQVRAGHASCLLDEALDLVSFPVLQPTKIPTPESFLDLMNKIKDIAIYRAKKLKELTLSEVYPRVYNMEAHPPMKWHIVGTSPFSSAKEEAKAAKDTARLWKVSMEDNLLLRHGIRYIPSAEPSASTMRTVLIYGVPSDSKLTEVLSWVRGGQVLTASLMNTTPIMGYETAMVTFVAGESCLRYEEMLAYYGNTLIPDGVAVGFLEEPTYPISRQIQQAIEKKQATRCLLMLGRIEDAHRALRKLKRKLPCKEYVDCIPKKKQRVFHFPSIMLALWAYEELCKDSEFGPQSVCFHEDPCAELLPIPAYDNYQ
ncbi:hypothetical protein N7456_004966 [Penicillium angulare]|uniref:Uncharacterized protein n=1 Tax=Penicillium angulare TaxID=116970 RepID=A0A9W9FXN3_9EURO|nr:hypothetical protein N7456_004966 [Penicillium angulare]